MPTISARLSDLGRLAGEPLDRETLDARLVGAKGEAKSLADSPDDLRIELADGNRPDLWSPEGIARQIRSMRRGKPDVYPFFGPGARPAGRIVVDEALRGVRPFIGGFTVEGFEVTDDGLRGMIEAQEKLCELFGRRRKAIAIGVYAADRIAWPIRYRAVAPDARRFVPLGASEEMDLARILRDHPTGAKYADVLKGFSLYPFLEDAEGRVLSFPPVINSADVGQVKIGDRRLFVEVTGTDLRQVILCVNIFAANLADRGGAIAPCEVEYPYDTPLGRSVVTPQDAARGVTVPFSEFERVLGVPVTAADLKKTFGAYGVRVKTQGKSVVVTPPPWRDDYLHPYDALEDYAIARGYAAFEPVPLACFTTGALDPLTEFGDRARDLLAGMGFEEVVSNVLTARERLRDRMGLPPGGLVEIENIYSETYSVMRDRLLPSLLEVEAESVKASYPHRIFEEGDVAVREGSTVKTRRKAAALVAHPDAAFSEAHGFLNLLLYYLDVDGSIEPADLPGFIPGRAARIRAGGKTIGEIGELHPAVLEAWGIKNPSVAFEVDLSALSPTRALS
jgi:phenylalanyl-tRNA synthetase beta chain